MKIVNANIHRSDNLDGCYGIYVGTHIGSFKKSIIGSSSEHPFKQIALQDVPSLEKGLKITAMAWSDDNRQEILLGNANGFVKIYNIKQNAFTHNVLANSEIVGCGKVDESRIVVGTKDGKVKVLGLISWDAVIADFSAGTDMSKLTQNPSDRNQIVTGGKGRENCLKLWDLTRKEAIFTSKNVKPDMLQLEVPVWDSDVAFWDEKTLVTSSRYGYIRCYDTRTQRRPVREYCSSKRDQLCFTTMAIYENTTYLGLSNGTINSFDLRTLHRPLSVFKGATGSVSGLSIDKSGRYICSSSLDRFVRIHSAQNNEVLYQNYIKLKGTSVLMGDMEKIIEETKTQEAEEEIVDDKGAIKDDEEPERNANDEGLEDIFSTMETVREKFEPIPHKRRRIKK